jgi:hypothetical protein
MALPSKGKSSQGDGQGQSPMSRLHFEPRHFVLNHYSHVGLAWLCISSPFSAFIASFSLWVTSSIGQLTVGKSSLALDNLCAEANLGNVQSSFYHRRTLGASCFNVCIVSVVAITYSNKSADYPNNASDPSPRNSWHPPMVVLSL